MPPRLHVICVCLGVEREDLIVEDSNARMFTQNQHSVLRLLFGKTKRGYVTRLRVDAIGSKNEHL